MEYIKITTGHKESQSNSLKEVGLCFVRLMQDADESQAKFSFQSTISSYLVWLLAPQSG
jgi:hypothetical protein